MALLYMDATLTVIRKTTLCCLYIFHMKGKKWCWCCSLVLDDDKYLSFRDPRRLLYWNPLKPRCPCPPGSGGRLFLSGSSPSAVKKTHKWLGFRLETMAVKTVPPQSGLVVHDMYVWLKVKVTKLPSTCLLLAFYLLVKQKERSYSVHPFN